MARLSTRPLSTRGSTSATGLTNGATSGGEEPRSVTARRLPVGRRNVPLMALGVLLVVVCAIGFSTAWLRAGHRQSVLVVTTNLAAGQVIAASDLRSVPLGSSEALSTVSAASQLSVVGQTVAVPLAAGSLLQPADLGPASVPRSGRAEVGLALKAGQYPPQLVAGAAVMVVISPSATASSSTAAPPVPGTVLAVEAAPASSATAAVVTVDVPKGDAATIATAATTGDASLVTVAGS